MYDGDKQCLLSKGEGNTVRLRKAYMMSKVLCPESSVHQMTDVQKFDILKKNIIYLSQVFATKLFKFCFIS